MQIDEIDSVLAEVQRINEEIAVVMQAASQVSGDVKRMQETTFKFGLDIANAGLRLNGRIEVVAIAGAIMAASYVVAPVIGKINQWKLDRQMKAIQKLRVDIAVEKKAMLEHAAAMSSRALVGLQRLVEQHSSRRAFGEDPTREALVHQGLCRSFNGYVSALIAARTVSYLQLEFAAWVDGRDGAGVPRPSAYAIAEECIAWLWDLSQFMTPRSPWALTSTFTHGAQLAIALGPRSEEFCTNRPDYRRTESLLSAGYTRSRILPVGESRAQFARFWDACIPPGYVTERARSDFRRTVLGAMSLALVASLVALASPIERYVAEHSTGVRLPPDERYATPCDAARLGPSTAPLLVLEEDFARWRSGVVNACYADRCHDLERAVESSSGQSIWDAVDSLNRPELSTATPQEACAATRSRWSSARALVDGLPVGAQLSAENSVKAWALVEELDSLLDTSVSAAIHASRRVEIADLCSSEALSAGMGAERRRDWAEAQRLLRQALACSSAASERERLSRHDVHRAEQTLAALERRLGRDVE